jgi:hypothetical protein
MNTWNNSVQYQMLLEALNFSNNSMAILPCEFINRCKAEIAVISPIANCLVTTATDIPKQELTDFLYSIPFAADSTHMECSIRIDNNITWITNGIVQITMFHTADGLNFFTTCVNFLLLCFQMFAI